MREEDEEEPMKHLRMYAVAVVACLVLAGVLMFGPSLTAEQAAGGAAPAAGGRGGRAAATPQPMSFFVTSAGKGDGGNLGGLAGADAFCTTLATASGRG